MSKRKISCSACRLKKLKCSGGNPCERCQLKQTECVYSKPGQVGRPPKNAVVNKFVRVRTDSTIYPEFIFEHISKLAPIRYLKDSKTHGLAYHLNNLYAIYSKSKVAVHKEQQNVLLIKKGKSIKELQIDDLHHYFIWMSAEASSVMVRRLSRLRLTLYHCQDFLISTFTDDPSTTFFNSSSQALVPNNPLNLLSPHQALRLIDIFFCVHPYAVMFNKTMLLQSYLTDTIDPFLLSVIFGTTLFMSSTTEGKPLDVWQPTNLEMRNSFLDYAYFLLSKLSAETTISRYQAVVLLALFEVMFGFTKKGVSLFALSYRIADKLGMFNGTIPSGLTSVEKELLSISFWAAFQISIRGCIECKKEKRKEKETLLILLILIAVVQVPRLVLSYRNRSYPPINSIMSLSFQADIENGNLRSFKHYNYIVETFYIQSVISNFDCNLLCILPQEKSAAFVDQEFERILHELLSFIEKERHQFSKLQEFALELHYSFYAICFGFLRKSVYKDSFKIQQSLSVPEKLDLTDPENVRCIHQVLPKALSAIDKIAEFVNGDPTNYYSDVKLLPRAMMSFTIDAASKVLMYHYILEKTPLVGQYLELLKTIVYHPTIWERCELISLIKSEISEFLQNHPPLTDMTSSLDLFNSTPFWLDNRLFQEADCLNLALYMNTADWELPVDLNVFDMNFMQ